MFPGRHLAAGGQRRREAQTFDCTFDAGISSGEPERCLTHSGRGINLDFMKISAHRVGKLRPFARRALEWLAGRRVARVELLAFAYVPTS